MLIKLNKRFRLIFLKYLKDSENTYNSSSSYYTGNYRYIYFYEWGDMGKNSKIFRDTKDFYEFLKESNITCTESQKSLINNSQWVYAVCAPNKNILLVDNQYFSLKEKLEKFKNHNYCTSLSPMYK